MSSCEVCHGLCLDDTNKRRLFLEFTPSEFQYSALEAKCQPCGVLRDGILLMQECADPDNQWSFASDVSRVYGHALATDTDTLALEVYFIQGRPKLVVEFFRTDPHAPDPTTVPWLNSIRHRTRITGHPLSPEALAWTRSMLDRCSTEHKCRQPPFDAPLPSRVLAIGTLTPTGQSTLKLIETKNEEGKYATLSHCWGASPLPCVTTLNNLSERLSEIPWDKLPQTFHDVVQYCQQLEIQYLWIIAV